MNRKQAQERHPHGKFNPHPNSMMGRALAAGDRETLDLINRRRNEDANDRSVFVTQMQTQVIGRKYSSATAGPSGQSGWDVAA